jgi:hypothetical protein
MPPEADLRQAGKVLECDDGAFRFEPREIPRLEGKVLSLAAFAEAAAASKHLPDSADNSRDIDRLLAGEIIEISQPASRPNIHVLPAAPPTNPLDDLLADLEAEAPDELLFAQVGVVTQNPRGWRGSLERDWRRRGWELRHCSTSGEFSLEGLDVLVVHQHLASARVAREEEWLNLIYRAEQSDPQVPVVWVAPLGDPVWVHRLIEAGVSFLMPAPPGDAGETTARFMASLSLVVDRTLNAQQAKGGTELPTAVSELVDALLYEAAPEQAVGSLLQLTAEQVARGAVMIVEGTAIRCRAGFGFPLNREDPALPRGVGLLERVIRSGQALMEIEPEAGGARRLAGVLGIVELPEATSVIPLGRRGMVAGMLVADNAGEPLPDLAELVLIAGRLGGVIVGC